MAIQPSEFIHKNNLGFLEGNIIKYTCRHRLKGGKADILKARHYCDLLLEWEYEGAEKSQETRISKAKATKTPR